MVMEKAIDALSQAKQRCIFAAITSAPNIITITT